MNQTKKETLAEYFTTQGAKKRVLSLILTVCMIITLVPNLAVPVSAASTWTFGNTGNTNSTSNTGGLPSSLTFYIDDIGYIPVLRKYNASGSVISSNYCTTPYMSIYVGADQFSSNSSWNGTSGSMLGSGSVNYYATDSSGVETDVTLQGSTSSEWRSAVIQKAVVTWMKPLTGANSGITATIQWIVRYNRGASNFTHEWQISANGPVVGGIDFYYGGHHMLGGGNAGGYTYYDAVNNGIYTWGYPQNNNGLYMLRSDGAKEPYSYWSGNANDVSTYIYNNTKIRASLPANTPVAATVTQTGHTCFFMQWKETGTLAQGDVFKVEAAEGILSEGEMVVIAPAGRRVPPGVTASYDFTIINLTTDKIDIDLTAAVDALAAVAGWSASLSGATKLTETLDGYNAMTSVSVDVTVPNTATDGDMSHTTLTAKITSAIPSTVTSPLWTTTKSATINSTASDFVTTMVDTTVAVITDVQERNLTRSTMDVQVTWNNNLGTHATTIEIYNQDGTPKSSTGLPYSITTQSISSGNLVTGIDVSMLTPGNTYRIKVWVDGIEYPHFQRTFTMRGDEASGYIWKDFNGNDAMESFEGLYGIDMVLLENRTSSQSYRFNTTSIARGVVSFKSDTTGTQQHSHYPQGEYIVYPDVDPFKYAVENIVAYSGITPLTDGYIDSIFEYFRDTTYNGKPAIEYKFKSGQSAAITFYVQLTESAVVYIHPHTGSQSSPTYVEGAEVSVDYTTLKGHTDTVGSPGPMILTDLPYPLSFPAYSNAIITLTAPLGYRLADGKITGSRDKNNLAPYTPNNRAYDEYFQLVAGDVRLTGVSDTASGGASALADPTSDPACVQTTVTTAWAGINAQLDFKAWDNSAAPITNPNRGNYTWTLESDSNNTIKNFDTSTGKFTFTGNSGTAKVKVALSTNLNLSHEMEIIVTSAIPPTVDRIYIAKASDINTEISNIALTRGDTQELVVVGVDSTGKARIMNTLASLDSDNIAILTSDPTSGDAYKFTVKGIASGWTTIKASYVVNGTTHTATAYALVTASPINTATIQISPNPVNLTSIGTGSTQELTYTVTFQNPSHNVVIAPEMVTPTVADTGIATIDSDNKTMNYVSNGTTSVTATLNALETVKGTATVNCSSGGAVVTPDGILTLQEATSPIKGGFIEEGTTSEYFAFFDKNGNGVWDLGETILPYGTANTVFSASNSHFSTGAGTSPNVELTGNTPGVAKLTVTYIYNGTTYTASTDIVVYSSGYTWNKLEVTPSPVVMQVGATQTFTVQAVFTYGNNVEKHTLPTTMYKGSIPTGSGYVSLVTGTQNQVKANIELQEAVYRATLNIIPTTISNGSGDAKILVIPVGAKLKVTPDPLWIEKGETETVSYELVSSTGETLTAPNLINYISATIADTNVATMGSPITNVNGIKVGRTTLTANLYGQSAQVITVYVWDDEYTYTNNYPVVTGIEWIPNSITINAGYTGTSGVCLINTDGTQGAAVYLEHLTALTVEDTSVATIPASPSGTSLTVTGGSVTADRNTKVIATSPAGNADLTVNVLTGVTVSGIKAEPAIIELWPGETKTVTVKNTGTGVALDNAQLTATTKVLNDMNGTTTTENDIAVVGSALKLSQKNSGVSAPSVNLLTLTYNGKSTQVYIINYTEDPYANGNVRTLTLDPNPVTMELGDTADVAVILKLTEADGTSIDTLTLPAAVVTWSKNTSSNLPGRIDIAASVLPDTIAVKGTTAGAQTYKVTYSGGNTPISADGKAFVFAQNSLNILDFYFEPDAVVLTPGDSKTIRGVIEYNGSKQYVTPQELPIAVPDLASDNSAIATVSANGIIVGGNLNGEIIRETFVTGTLIGTSLTGRTDVLVYDPNAQMRIDPNAFTIYTPGDPLKPNTQNIITWLGNYQVPNKFLTYSVNNGNVSLTPDISGDEYTVTGLTVGMDEIKSLLRNTTKSATANVEVLDANAVYWTVTYDANGGTGIMNPLTEAQGVQHTVQANGFTPPSGEYFVEWRDGSGTTYVPGAPLTVLGDVTLYAQWTTITPSSYTVTYDSNDLTGTTTTDTGAPGVNYTVLSNTFPAPTGHRFIKWNTSASGNGTSYVSGSTFVLNSDVTLYAIWEDEITVTYDANGGSGTMSSYKGIAGDTYIVLPNTFVRSGYQFKEWNEDANKNGTSWNPGDTFSIGNNDITLYAIWEEVSEEPYKVTYDANGATTGSAPTDDSTYSYNELVTILGDNNMSNTGYVFAGWELDGTIYQEGDTYQITEDVTFYAVWKPVSSVYHTVTYNANGGSGAMSPDTDTVFDGELYTVRENEFRAPFETQQFKEWNTETDGSGRAYNKDDVITELDDNLTLYAIWKDITPGATYTVTYDANDATAGTAPTDSNNYSTNDSVTILGDNGMTKTGHTFIGWALNRTGTGTIYLENDTYLITSDNVTFYAVWDDNASPEYFWLTITAGTGGSVNTSASGYYKAGYEIPITATPNASYTFINWTSTVSGVIANTSRSSTTVTMPASDVTVTANFTSTGGGLIIIPPFIFPSDENGGSTNPNTPPERPAKDTPVVTDKTYTVTYTANEGIGNDYKVPGIPSGTKHTVLDVASAKISYPDHVFTGWNTKADGTGTSYAPGEKLTVTSDITLYAQWRVRVLLETDEHILYLNGYGDGTVRADNAITRAEAASIFYRLLKTQGEAEAGMFSDVDSSKWYAKAVNYLASMGILTGYADGTFKPDAPITRAEFATIATRFDTLISLDGENNFKDVPDTHWAVKYINAGVAKGWINGYGDGTFKPDESITRAQVVKIVNAMLERKIDDAALAIVVNPYTDISKNHWAYAEIIEASVPHEYTRDEDGNEIWEY